MMSHFFDV